MVCADTKAAVGPSRIAGGFVLVPVATLIACWRACRAKPLGIGDFRAWLAAHEMTARRCGTPEGRDPVYSMAELADLLGVAGRRAKASVCRLAAAGLLEWSEAAIGFPEAGREDPGLADTISQGRGSVAIPRRTLRFLASGARPALIATALGILLRCLSRRRRGWDGRGRLKASWIASTFGVDLRRVKAARGELVQIGWIEIEPGDQWAMNRWGRAYRIDSAWDRPRPVDRQSPPPPAADGPPLPPPESHLEPLPERNQHQEPAPGGPPGAQLGGDGEGNKPLTPPKLDDVRHEDLADTGRVLELHAQAVARGLVASSEADRLNVVAAAEHARAVGKANPAGLFVHLVRGRLWHYLRQEDEDRAQGRIKAYFRGPGPSSAAVRSPLRPSGLSADAELVREVRATLIRSGHFGDPYSVFARWHPGWSRERWDLAWVEASRRIGWSGR